MKLLLTSWLHVLGRICLCSCLLFFFSLSMLAFLIFSPPRYNFHLFLPTKLVSVVIYFSLTDYQKLILHWFACGVDGRLLARSVYGHMITKFSGMGRLPHFLSYGAPPTSGACGAPLQMYIS